MSFSAVNCVPVVCSFSNQPVSCLHGNTLILAYIKHLSLSNRNYSLETLRCDHTLSTIQCSTTEGYSCAPMGGLSPLIDRPTSRHVHVRYFSAKVITVYVLYVCLEHLFYDVCICPPRNKVHWYAIITTIVDTTYLKFFTLK